MFLHPWALLLALLPLAWVVWSWPRSSPHSGLLLKALSFVAICCAFSEPTLLLPQTKTGILVLVDTSLSITGDDLRRASSILSEMERHRRGNWLRIVPFASRTRALLPNEVSPGLHLVKTANPSGSGTNFEAALTGTMSAFPSGHLPRLVLISDGNVNEGSTARAIAELESLHVPVDTIPLDGRSRTALRLESLSMPHEAYAGEQIPIDLSIRSPRPAHALVRLSADGKDLGSKAVDLTAGLNSVRVDARLESSGAASVSGTIAAPPLGQLSFENAIELRRATILYLSDDPSGSDANLLQAFTEAGFDLTRDASLIARDLGTVQLIVLNNLDLNGFTSFQKNRIEEYVKDGGGLLLIGGERQVYKEDRQLDALDRALPAKLAPPNTPEGTCVALIIDKSSSMEGRKIDLARLSAIGVVDHLRPIDTIGVLIFDNSFQWAVPMRRAEDKPLIKRLISGITPDGGTQIAPALAEAYHRVLPSKATYKHIVLLTDGISEEGDSIDLAKEALQHDVTISTIGLGQDVNRAYLDKVASTSGGRSYFLNEPQGLEQILLKDVKDYSGSTAVEKPLTPIIVRKAEILDGIAMDTAPPLKGYARFIAKPQAETILDINGEKKDPLYVRWQYGLGRAAVFASDAKSRWAEAWVDWPGFDKFWINATRDLLPHSERNDANAQFDSANGDLYVSYRLAAETADPAAVPPIYVLGPHRFEKPVEVRKSSRGLYTGRLHIGALGGLFRIRPLVESAAFPEVGLYRPQQELEDYGSNPALLAQISALTGGRFNPPPASVFDSNGRTGVVQWQLWPAMLALAIALTIVELIARKWSGVVLTLRRS